MNLLLYGEPGQQLSELASVLRPMEPESVRVAGNWGAFERGVEESVPDLAILCFQPFLKSDAQTAVMAHEYLVERGIPAVVAVTQGSPTERRLAEIVAGFEVLVEAPLTTRDLKAAIDAALEIPPEPMHVTLDTGRRVSDAFPAASQSGDREAADAPIEASLVSASAPPTEAEGPRRRSYEASGDQKQPRDDQSDPGKSKEVASRSVDEDPEVDADQLDVHVWSEPEARGGGDSNPGQRKRSHTPSSVKLQRPMTHRPALPVLHQGSLKDVSPLRLFFLHHVAGSTGKLVFTMDRIQRTITYVDGVPGVGNASGIDSATRSKLMASLLWDRGVYAFESQRVPSGSFHPLGDLLELMHQTIHEKMTLNRVLAPLTALYKRYPTATDRVVRYDTKLGRLTGVIDFLNRCGRVTLEGIAGSNPHNMEVLLKNALFCHTADLVCFLEEPTNARVGVVYDLEKVRPPSPQAPAAPVRRRASPSAEERDDEEEVMEELAERARRYTSAPPYELFGLEPGCGRRAVQDAYYALVKRHHPDTYALARSPNIKPLAEMVFRAVRSAYNELLREEVHEAPHSSFSNSGRAAPSGANPGSTPPPVGTDSAGHSRAATGSTPAVGRRNERAHSTEHRSVGADTLRQGPLPPERIDGGEAPVRESPTRRVPTAPQPPVTPPPVAPGNTPRPAVPTSPRSLSHPTGSVKHLFKTGVSYMQAGAYEKALEAFSLAHEKQPDNATYLAHCAWASYQADTSRAREAMRMLKKALTDQHDETRGEYASLFLGHILTAEGETDKAVEYYRTCLGVNPRNIEAKRRLRLYDMRKKSQSNLFGKIFTKRKKSRK